VSLTERDWDSALSQLGVRPLTAAKWAAPFADEVQPEKFSHGMDDMLCWLPQILHECMMLERLEESLTYTAERIRAVWPTRFATVAAALPYAFAPERLGNLVYANRMGNGDVVSGDGYRFRGRGPIMATGRDAYRLLSDLCGQDFIDLPELLLQPRFGLEASIAWWEDRVPDDFLSDQVKLRKRVNGGTLGLEHVAGLHARAREVFA
jgi:putative chitinase